jgi:hypothetical protein
MPRTRICPARSPSGGLTALFHGRDRIAGLVCGGKVRLRGQVDVSESSPGGAGRDEC